MKTLVYTLSLVSLSFCLACSQKKEVLNSSLTSPSTTCAGMNQEACETFQAINEVRVQNGLQPLSALTKCIEMAQDHAEDMVARNFFSHDSPTETFGQRAARYRLSGGWVGENISRANSSQQAVQGWMGSTGHRNNILSRNYASSGMGYAQGLYVQCFSSYQGDVSLQIIE